MTILAMSALVFGAAFVAPKADVSFGSSAALRSRKAQGGLVADSSHQAPSERRVPILAGLGVGACEAAGNLTRSRLETTVGYAGLTQRTRIDV